MSLWSSTGPTPSLQCTPAQQIMEATEPVMQQEKDVEEVEGAKNAGEEETLPALPDSWTYDSSRPLKKQSTNLWEW
uniref:Uncharacterized protein n=1 Tax=Chromera velia CCMP2878 TaxID=1169474 RepID=A0A0G4FU20_9ALVE|eukprot:Cvel_18766.t1-p1 / transcript=Cvel_18766.t1 / gene=Cvel_18766 / organism=Chromera_velia_CCMP2878 / gene_product=hypothetical protein / transcript_product=hypothetical protein / location=Cvel_scaffold1574:39860-41351(+) / protein_length=75 / sequence_SO=supercontig / SO=protein_coding / is_pseudo=false